MQTVVYLKTIGIVSTLLVFVYILCIKIAEPIYAQNYFSLSWQYSIQVIALMLITTILFSLTIGIWDSYYPYLVVALPVCIILFIVLMGFNLTYAVIFSGFFFALLSYDIYKSQRLKNNFIYFTPAYILRFSTWGLLFIFSVLGAVMTLLSSPSLPEIDIGKNIATMVQKPLKNMIEQELTNQLRLQNVDQNTLDQLKPYITPPITDVASYVDVQSFLEKRINSLIEPYKNFLHSLLAIWIFFVFQFYSFITKVLYVLIIDFVFLIAKKFNFFTITKVTVEKEVISF